MGTVSGQGDVCYLPHIILILIMDSSYLAQMFSSRKLNGLAHTIHANVHTYTNIIYIHTHTHIHTHTSIHTHTNTINTLANSKCKFDLEQSCPAAYSE